MPGAFVTVVVVTGECGCISGRVICFLVYMAGYTVFEHTEAARLCILRRDRRSNGRIGFSIFWVLGVKQ